MYFLALSQAPPPLAIMRAMSTPVRVAPASIPPSASLPNKRPTVIGAKMAVIPGRIISRRAAVVAISTHRALSGLAVPSIRPGISRNWRRISLTILKAARPTLVMVMAAIEKGMAPPMKTPMITSALVMSMLSSWTA